VGHSRDAVYVAVLPAYRQACIDALLEEAPDVALFASPAHLDRSVRTGIDPKLYRSVPMIRIGGKLFVQTGPLDEVLGVRNLIVDLNPRSATAWLLLLLRRLARSRRTLVWGHIFPRLGPDSKTGLLRRLMIRMSDGVIAYTYSQARDFKSDRRSPTRPVWIAPNSLYSRSALGASSSGSRGAILYVGRLEPSKNVHLIIPAFAEARRRELIGKEVELVIVGTGTCWSDMKSMATELGVEPSVRFLGEVYEVNQLRRIYDTSFVSLSPGFAGLGLTQSLGFGVPQIVNRQAVHSPEIELAESGEVIWFDSNTQEGREWARGLAFQQRDRVPGEQAVQLISETYSAEGMSRGLLEALGGGHGTV
jgi:glycosyltransferase involved in cell wall biosynthesis